MQRKARASILAVAIVMVIAVLTVSPTLAQSNLLTNPGFEAPFVTSPGTPPMQVAQGWTPWHVGALPGMSLSENIQPEYYPATDTVNGLGVPHINSGTDAQQYSSFFATHTGGVYQRVSGVTPGVEYRFSVQGYVWSSTFDNPNQSQDDGGVVLQVAIDPVGGQPNMNDPEAAQAYIDGLTWSTPVANQYDGFDQYSITATAQGSDITVYVRSIVSFPVKNNVTYLDDASLTTTSAPATNTSAPATNTSVPPTRTSAPATNTAVPPSRTSVPPTNTTVPSTTEPAVTAEIIPTNTNTAVPPTRTSAPATNTTVPPTAQGASPTPPPTLTLPATITQAPPTNTTVPVTPSPYPTVNRTQFPATIEHVVQPGQSVFVIASLYGSSVEAVISLNNLPSNALIFAGQRLLIPVGLLAPMTATAGSVPTLPPATILPTVPPAIPPTQAPPAVTEYVVRPGDTLSSIAVRFGVTVRALIEANGITNPNLIFYGQRLQIPTGQQPPGLPPLPTAIVLPTRPSNFVPTPLPTVPAIQTYRIQQGDSLYTVALRFNVPLPALIQFNGITNPNRVFPGQIIVIPPS